MSTGSAIEWTDATWNPVTGCTRVSAGCDNCYAVTMTHRLDAMEAKRGVPEGGGKYRGLTVLNQRGDRHFNGKVRCHEDYFSLECEGELWGWSEEDVSLWIKLEDRPAARRVGGEDRDA